MHAQVRAAAFRPADLEWNTPHAPILRGRAHAEWCMHDEDANCTRIPTMPFDRRPCTGFGALVYHRAHHTNARMAC